MNSIVDPFVIKKLLKNGIFGSVNSTLIHCSLWKSQHLLLLYNEQCINNSRITPKRVKTKKNVRNMKITNADTAKAQSKRTLKQSK